MSAEQLELSWGSQPRIMGILNATPDSFSGDGLDDAVDALVGRGQAQARAGAAILDIGGESTRPGATPVPAAEERRRVLPVIERLAREVDVPISIDTSKAEVAAAALEAGARIVNDVSGLIDPRLAPTAAKYGAWLVLTHNGWTLGYAPPPERDLVDEVVGVLERLADQALKAGVPEDRVIVDPGLGFGKPAADSLELLRRMPELHARLAPFPLLVGPSRKSFVGLALDLPVEERLEGTLACVAAAVFAGAEIVRVHDVQPAVRAARMAWAIRCGLG